MPNASDFVLSFILKAPMSGEVVVDETHRLPDLEVGSALASATLWESPPAWLTAWWEGGLSRAEEEYSEAPNLSLWISRGMKTAQLYQDSRLEGRNNNDRALDFGLGRLVRGYYGPDWGFLHVSFLFDGRLEFTFSSMDNRESRRDNDSILRAFDKTLNSIRPRASDLSED